VFDIERIKSNLFSLCEIELTFDVFRDKLCLIQGS
jgi:hypothetical protein